MPQLIQLAGANDNYVVRTGVDYINTIEVTGGSASLGDPSGTSMPVGQLFGGTDWAFYEAFYEFDISSLAPGTHITDAHITVYADTVDAPPDHLVLQAREWNYGSAVSTGDWVPGSNLAALPLYGAVEVPAGSSGLRALTSATLVSTVQSLVDDELSPLRCVMVVEDMVDEDDSRSANCYLDSSEGGLAFLVVDYDLPTIGGFSLGGLH